MASPNIYIDYNVTQYSLNSTTFNCNDDSRAGAVETHTLIIRDEGHTMERFMGPTILNMHTVMRETGMTRKKHYHNVEVHQL